MLKAVRVQYQGKQYEIEFKDSSDEIECLSRFDSANRPSGKTNVKRTLLSSLWTPAEVRRALDKPEVKAVVKLALEKRAKPK